MTDDRENLLLDAVDALTKPVRTKIIQDGPTGTGLAGQHTVTVELPPMLEQLDLAIRGSMVGIGGSGSLAHQRNVINADAFYLFTKISSTIKDWARIVGAKVTPDDIGATLRAWYTKYTIKQVTLDAERFYTRQMSTWAGQIESNLRPLRMLIIPGRCPVCSADTWWSKANHEEYKFPLVTEYNAENGANLVQSARSLCRACETVWSVRELAYLLEHPAGEASA